MKNIDFLKNILQHPTIIPGMIKTGEFPVCYKAIYTLFDTEQHNPYHRFTNAGYHTVDAIINSPADFNIRLALLYHDTGKAETKETINGVDMFRGHADVSVRLAEEELRNVGISEEILNAVIPMIKHHGRQIINRDKAIRRFIFKVGKENATNIMIVKLADDMAKDTSNPAVKENISQNIKIFRRIREILNTP